MTALAVRAEDGPSARVSFRSPADPSAGGRVRKTLDPLSYLVYFCGMSPEQFEDVANKAKDAWEAYSKACASMGKSANPADIGVSAAGPRIVTPPPPEVKLNPAEDPSTMAPPLRDQAPRNPVGGAAFSKGQDKGQDKTDFFAPNRRPEAMTKSVSKGAAIIAPEALTASGNLMLLARTPFRKSKACVCGHEQDEAINVCMNCGRGPSANGEMVLSPEIVRRLVG